MKINNKAWYLIKWNQNIIIETHAKKKFHLILDPAHESNLIEAGWYEIINNSKSITIAKGKLLSKVLENKERDISEFKKNRLIDLLGIFI